MKPAKRTPFSAMPNAELDRLAAPYDSREIDASEFRPLTPRMRREEAAARRKKPGRPRVGKGAARVLITMERGLLEDLDRATRTENVSRATFIADAVRAKLRRSA